MVLNWMFWNQGRYYLNQEGVCCSEMASTIQQPATQHNEMDSESIADGFGFEVNVDDEEESEITSILICDAESDNDESVDEHVCPN